MSSFVISHSDSLLHIKFSCSGDSIFFSFLQFLHGFYSFLHFYMLFTFFSGFYVGFFHILQGFLHFYSFLHVFTVFLGGVFTFPRFFLNHSISPIMFKNDLLDLHTVQQYIQAVQFLFNTGHFNTGPHKMSGFLHQFDFGGSQWFTDHRFTCLQIDILASMKYDRISERPSPFSHMTSINSQIPGRSQVDPGRSQPQPLSPFAPWFTDQRFTCLQIKINIGILEI